MAESPILSSGAEMKTPGECSVCGESGAEAGALGCGHHFCLECFERFLVNSLQELNTELRCCVCGYINPLIRETHQDEVQVQFGRNQSASLVTPVGLAQHHCTGDYIILDRSLQRVFIFNTYGQLTTDFAHVFGFVAAKDLVSDHEGHIIIPLTRGEKRQLGIYTPKGSFLNSVYLPSGTEIEGLAVNSKNQFLVSDSAKSLVYIIQNQRVVKAIDLKQFADEHFQPKPTGVAVNGNDDVIVIDTANHHIRVYDAQGLFKFKFGQKGSQAGQFLHPLAVCVDNENRIILADTGNNRVQLFSPDGTFYRIVVRYNRGCDVYMAPCDVVCNGMDEVAVLLQGTRAALAGQVRVYKISGPRT